MLAGLKATLTPKSFAICARSFSIADASPKPFNMTSQPAAASARAMPRPMPLVEPVTIAVFPFRTSMLAFAGLSISLLGSKFRFTSVSHEVGSGPVPRHPAGAIDTIRRRRCAALNRFRTVQPTRFLVHPEGGCSPPVPGVALRRPIRSSAACGSISPIHSVIVHSRAPPRTRAPVPWTVSHFDSAWPISEAKSRLRSLLLALTCLIRSGCHGLPGSRFTCFRRPSLGERTGELLIDPLALFE